MVNSYGSMEVMHNYYIYIYKYLYYLWPNWNSPEDSWNDAKIWGLFPFLAIIAVM